jgi:hypothetical protein
MKAGVEALALCAQVWYSSRRRSAESRTLFLLARHRFNSPV